jgi:glycosyltransferase involved in cell wall biosynthesis
MNRVSVVVPTYNQSQYLPACLDSLWFQDYKDIEIIVINDGSTDDTQEALKRYQTRLKNDSVSYAGYYDETDDSVQRVFHERYPKDGRLLKVIEFGVNQGLATALNTGFRICTGVYCTYIPSDDICYPTMLSELASALEKSDADFVYGDMFIVDDSGNILRKFELPDYSFKQCFQNWYLCGLAKLYRKELHQRFGFYDQDLLAHDVELYLRFAINGVKFVHVSKVLMAVRDHGSGRLIDIHSPTNWSRLIEECKEQVRKARRFSDSMST